MYHMYDSFLRSACETTIIDLYKPFWTIHHRHLLPLGHSQQDHPHYSQTFDHRSSLGFALAAGFPAGAAGGGAGSPHGSAEIGAVKLGTAGVSGAAVFHPPKSSSAAILCGEGFTGENAEAPKPRPPGGDCMLLKPPPAFNPALGAGELPQPKSPPVADDTEGDLTLDCVCGVGAVGSGVAHALLDAHGSTVGMENVLLVGGAEDCTTGW